MTYGFYGLYGRAELASAEVRIIRKIRRRFILFLFAFLLFLPFPVGAQRLWSRAHLDSVRQWRDTPFYRESYAHLLQQADSLLALPPLSVMQKQVVPPSGTKHDYMSMARYFWPDPTKPDGRPYVNRDGVTNPEISRYDREALGQMADRVTTLALADYLSGDHRYGQKAAEQVRTWFLDVGTRMNPNLNYAQHVPGLNGDRGRSYGVLDTYSLVEMLDGVQLLEQTGALTRRDVKGLRAWFSSLLDWMLASPQGREEAQAANNHAIAYDAQVMAFALYSGRQQQVADVLDRFDAERLEKQIADDGSQPAELWRTLSFGYSEYNLSHIIDIALMARSAGRDIGRRYERGLDFLSRYLGRRSEWPHQQISQWDEKEQALCQDLYKAGTWLDATRTDYVRLFNEHRRLDRRDRFYLLYYKTTEADQLLARADRQLRLALRLVKQAAADPKNAAHRRFAPRTIARDGQLVLVDANDWCAGFFAGELWQLYAYTHDDYWLWEAISQTWPVEPNKWHTSSHDVGFVTNNSFGKAYALTAERSYRDVVIQAAKTLIRRFNPVVGCIRSWDFNRDRWHYPVIIDNMMNLEMLFEATRLTGDSTYWHVAVSHANTTLRNHFRPDGSSFHVVDYDPATGLVRLRCTAQGHADDSWWSRGQGWGLYGFTMCYRYTRDERYLQQARHIADFILSWQLPADGVPYWDMRSPDIPNTERDASAAAVIASALLELSGYVDSGLVAVYRTKAEELLQALAATCLMPEGEGYGFLLQHSVGHHPAGSEIDVPLNYADYYWLEALLRIQNDNKDNF